MRLYNADGSPSELSGNGLRCLAALVLHLRRQAGEPPPAEVKVDTDAGWKTLALVARNERRYTFRAAMGQPENVARETLDVVNPYVTDRGMIRRIAAAAQRGVEVRLFVPASPNNWACAAAQQFHHGTLLDAGVRILEHPAMLHAKAFARDGEELLVGTCNLEAWSLKRFFEIDVLVRSPAAVARMLRSNCCSGSVPSSVLIQTPKSASGRSPTTL